MVWRDYRNFLGKVAILWLCVLSVYGQRVVSGNLSTRGNQAIVLHGFDGFKTYLIDSTFTDQDGSFQLHYDAKRDYGMGYLQSADQKVFFVVLTGEHILLEGEELAQPHSIKIQIGAENIAFGKYATEHPRREQILSAWNYLAKIYKADSLFAIHTKTTQSIAQEMQRIKAEDSTFLASLKPSSYVSWFLPIRKMVSEAPLIVQYRPEEIPAAIEAFRLINYTDPRLYKSGLFKDVIENHFLLIENSGRPLDSVYVEMKNSIDVMLVNLMKDEKKFNEVTDYLFSFLESRSLFQASEYLAIKVLNESSCTINVDLVKQLETYRAMKKGNTAPDIEFVGDKLLGNYSEKEFPNKLSDIKSNYTLIVFGASWCPKCTEEIPQIASLYSKWKANGVEVVWISLDENKESFEQFGKNLPFIGICNYEKWDSPIVKNYYVFSTPTMYLLDGKREILLRPNSVKHLNAWIDWNLVKQNN